MKFIKEDSEERRDYIFQKNKKTTTGFQFICIVLILLIIGVVISGAILEYF